MQDLPIPIIQSKLYPAPVPSDAVSRQRLMEKTPLTGHSRCALVSAPAGYGKSTLVAQWLAAADTLTAWLSLDSANNDLRQFLSYCIAAIRTSLPDAFPSLASLLNATELAAPEQLAESFCLEFEALGQPLVLALDDYHTINSAEIHDFLSLLLQRPPQGLHLVVVTRRDPPLALQSLRATGAMTEIRIQQLAFTAAESSTFIRSALHDKVSAAAADRLHERTEGWPAALRLASLAAPQSDDSGTFINRIPSDIHHIHSYLMQEVLAKCSKADRELLLRTAFLDRFCAELCDALLVAGNEGRGKTFVARVRDAGLFGIALDDTAKWYRYHHLFQSMLRDEAKATLGAEEIITVHSRAANWSEQHGLLEEAIRQLMKADLVDDAASLIIRHRNEIMNAEQWHRLAVMLRTLPDGMVESRPELLLLLGRLHRTRGAREELEAALNAANQLLGTVPMEPELRRELEGSLESNRCYQYYAASDGQAAVAAARRALELLPANSQAERGFAMVILPAAMQMTGDTVGARSLLYAAIPDEAAESPTYVTRLLVSLGFINWMDADLTGLAPTANRVMELATPDNLREVLTIGQGFRASIDYHLNDLAAVNDLLGDSASSDVVISAEFYAQNMMITALAHQESGRPQVASSIAASLQDLALNSKNVFLIGLAQAFSADLAVRQGRMAQALSWAAKYDPEPLTPMYGFLAPPTVLAKILVLADTEATRVRSKAYLERLVDYLESVHNQHFLIETLAIRSMLRDADGETAAANADLERAIRLAQPSRYIRLFVDLGPRLGSLMSRLNLDEEALHYVGEILAVFREGIARAPEQSPIAVSAGPGVEPLSKREQQILGLLSQRLSNKEIADSLHISAVTVKRHTANIYQKLGVHGRRQAVAKATGLGILQAAD